MKALYFWIFLLIFPLVGSESWNAKGPDGFSASAVISKAKALLPEAIVLELNLTYLNGYHIDEKVLLANLLRNPMPGAAPFLLLSLDKKKLDSSNGKINEKWTFQLEPQVAGKYGLTFLNIQFLPNATQEKPVEVVSGILDVEIILPTSVDHSFLPKEAPLKLSNIFPIDVSPKLRASLHQKAVENDPSRNVSRWEAKRFPWEIVCILLTLLAAGLYYKYGPRKKTASHVIKASQLQYQLADKKLAQLQQQKALEPALAEDYMFELSNAVRMEIEEKYHLKVLPDTTEEFFAKLKNTDLLEPKKLTKLTEFTRLADKVKYASHTPTLEECLAAKAAAQDIFHG